VSVGVGLETGVVLRQRKTKGMAMVGKTDQLRSFMKAKTKKMPGLPAAWGECIALHVYFVLRQFCSKDTPSRSPPNCPHHAQRTNTRSQQKIDDTEILK
jgi:hypothetical protein